MGEIATSEFLIRPESSHYLWATFIGTKIYNTGAKRTLLQGSEFCDLLMYYYLKSSFHHNLQMHCGLRCK